MQRIYLLEWLRKHLPTTALESLEAQCLARASTHRPGGGSRQETAGSP